MTHFPHYPSRRRPSPDGPIGCFLILWLMGLILGLAFWGLVGWALWTYIQSH